MKLKYEKSYQKKPDPRLPPPHSLPLVGPTGWQVMLDDEKADPSMLIDDLKSGGSTPGPRIQRLAIASNLPETEVAD